MVVILGGGISGLSAAYYALKNPKFGPLTIVEASNRVGGWIKSCNSKSGAIFEKGPRTLRYGAAGKNTLNLVDKLNLSDKIVPITPTHLAVKNRLIYVDKKIYVLPNSMTSFFKIVPPFERRLITALWTDLQAPQVKKDDESIYSFFERRLGKDVADYLVSPMVCGICAGDPHQISVNFLFKSFFKAEQEHGSIIRGILKNTKAKFDKNALPSKEPPRTEIIKRAGIEKWALWGLDGGLEQIPQTLSAYLSSQNVDVRLNSKCEKITFCPDSIELQVNGKVEHCSRLVSSLPSKALAPLLHDQHPQLAQELAAIPSVTVAVVNYEFEHNVFPMQAFGLLIPPDEKLPILGVIFDSCVFAQKSTVLTVMMGGAWFEHYFGQNPSEDHLKSVALKHVKDILKTNEDPIDCNAAILKDCIPQHIVGHNQRVARIRDYISSHNIPLDLCGTSYDGAGINDAILSAKNVIEGTS